MAARLSDPSLALSQLDQSEAIRKKMAVDGLKKNLTPGKNSEKKLKDACKGFESLFLSQLWKQMRSSVPKEGYLHSKEEEMYLSMFDQEMATKMADAGGIGLGDMLAKELKQQLKLTSRSTTPSSVVNPKPIKPLHAVTALEEQKAPTQMAAVRQEDGLQIETLYEPLRQNGVEEPKSESETGEEAGRKSREASAVGDVRVHVAGRAADSEPEFSASSGDSDGAVPLGDPELPSGENLKLSLDIARRVESQGAVSTENRTASLYGSDPAQRYGGNGPSRPMVWPVEGEVSSDFGWRRDPFTGEKAWHAGVDVAAAPGAPVQSCWDGTVVFAGPWQGYGNLVVVDHGGGWYSYYGHNSRVLVESGQRVTAGRKIAEVGDTGRATGTHLHFEVRQGDQAWDPKQVQERLLTGNSIGRKV